MTDPPATGSDVGELIAAATVVVGRDGGDGLEVLMLRRNSKLTFVGGMWVFPGGRVDEIDRQLATDDLPAVRHAAVREAAEEAGIALDPTQLVPLSHWTPPARPEATHRFSTAFFVAEASSIDHDVVIDGGEIVDHRWGTPAEVLSDHAQGAIELAPPTFLTLLHLTSATTAAEMLATARRGPVVHYATRIALHEDAVFAMYEGDAGYESGDGTAPGPRHRIHLHERPWRYERTP